MNNDIVIQSVKHWVETVVIGLNLCPFAKRELVRQKIRFSVSQATSEQQLLEDLTNELEKLQSTPSIETTLLIHPEVLQDFFDYNQFLYLVDELIAQANLQGVFQVASFHPDYQFAGTEPDDVENFTNRSPYPLLHLLREESLEAAIEKYPDTDLIPERNIKLMKELGLKRVTALLQSKSSKQVK